MKADVVIYAGEASPARVGGANAAVIDVFRATSVIVEALRNGAKAVVPVVSVEDAFAMCGRFERKRTLVGGERRMIRVEGFDLGNSPADYTPEAVAGKTVVLSTTNGTRALLNSRHAARLYVAAFLNMDAVCDRLAEGGRDVVLVCSGRMDKFTAEDGLCAGAMAGRLASRYGYELTDIAKLMLRTYEDAGREGVERWLSASRHYNDMMAAGLGDDIRFCLRTNIYDTVPFYQPYGEITI